MHYKNSDKNNYELNSSTSKEAHESIPNRLLSVYNGLDNKSVTNLSNININQELIEKQN